jgi:hypothetical protein
MKNHTPRKSRFLPWLSCLKARGLGQEGTAGDTQGTYLRRPRPVYNEQLRHLFAHAIILIAYEDVGTSAIKVGRRIHVRMMCISLTCR